MKKRKVYNIEPTPSKVSDLSTWTQEQIRLAGAWARHEVQARYDKFCEPYDWVPSWTGNLKPEVILDLVHLHYMHKTSN